MQTATHTIEFTQEALKTIEAMENQCHEIRHFYGDSHRKTRRAYQTLAHSLRAMIGLGGRISRDEDLSLYGVGFIHYGIVWFGDKNEGKIHREDLAEMGYERELPEGQEFLTMIGSPETGEWSVHS